MLKFAVSVYRVFRPDSAHPLQTYSPKCLEGVFSEVAPSSQSLLQWVKCALAATTGRKDSPLLPAPLRRE